MKILYVTCNHDPRDPNAGSGADHNYLQALLANDFSVEVHGVLGKIPTLIERLWKRSYEKMSRKKWMKFSPSVSWRIARSVERAIKKSKPDIVFTVFPTTLTFLHANVPCVARLDTTFLGLHQFYQIYGKAALRLSVLQEQRAFVKCARLITQSEWCRTDLIENYGFQADYIDVIPNASGLPSNAVPAEVNVREAKRIEGGLRLLFVGRDPLRKGLEVALRIPRELRRLGIEANLTICGLEGLSGEAVHFVGRLDKNDPAQLRQYSGLYREAHLLVHPALFDPSPIVTSEAAAFATPTITNDVGGMATSVKDGVSGLVLRRNCHASEYASAISSLVQDQERYHRLCLTTRQRYEQDLNWKVAGRRVGDSIKKALVGTGSRE